MIIKNINDETLPFKVKKYFKKYSDSKWCLELSESKFYNTVIVIPAIAEFENIKLLLDSLAENDKKYFDETLIVFAINNLPDAEITVKADNKNSIELFKSIINKEENELNSKILNSGLNFGLVDMSTSGNEMPQKDGGVGVARKTGMDLALTVFNYESSSKKVIVCLDADCTVSQNYITEINKEFTSRNLFAAYVNFHHSHNGSEEQQLAIICYEIFLRNYVLGLKYAKSPYGFHTIGSTMACDYESYIKIQGMNKRKAAEDFYFMEKLAKNVKVQSIRTATVFPSGRGSWRVPFGTGQRVNRYLSHAKNEYLLYNPGSFRMLKEWLNVFLAADNFTSERYMELAGQINPAVKSFLIEQSFEKAWDKILANSGKAEQIQRQKSLWFDGFRTLKFIHFLRDNGFPSVSMFDALDSMFQLNSTHFKIERESKIPDKDIQLKYLEILRKQA
ncbi:MAG: hypothetical protein JEY94_04805 [Melioribacteraceae bacterium]|nr:hypothetical protein [Melioribacteraceae bacterium]